MELVRVENLTFTYPEAAGAALTAVNLSLGLPANSSRSAAKAAAANPLCYGS